jgi:hypothetical protein
MAAYLMKKIMTKKKMTTTMIKIHFSMTKMKIQNMMSMIIINMTKMKISMSMNMIMIMIFEIFNFLISLFKKLVK